MFLRLMLHPHDNEGTRAKRKQFSMLVQHACSEKKSSSPTPPHTHDSCTPRTIEHDVRRSQGRRVAARCVVIQSDKRVMCCLLRAVTNLSEDEIPAKGVPQRASMHGGWRLHDHVILGASGTVQVQALRVLQSWTEPPHTWRIFSRELVFSSKV